MSVLISVVQVAVAIPALGQDQFVHAIGGSRSDFGHSVVQISGGNFVVAGRTETWAKGEFDILFSRISASGNHYFSQTLGGVEYEEANCIIEVSDGNLVMVGKTKSYGAGDYDLILTKVGSFGTRIWSKTLGGAPFFDTGLCVIETSNSDLVVTGETANFGSGGSDVLLAKFDASGTLLWMRTLGGSVYKDEGKSVIEVSGGGFVIGGETSAYGAGSVDVLLAKFDADGTHLWTTTLGGTDAESVNSVIETSDEGFVVVGSTRSFGAGQYDCLLAKFDASGIYQWAKTLGGAETDHAIAGIKTSDGDLVITGYTASFGDGDDFLLAKLEASGSHLWTRVLGGTNQLGQSVIETAGGTLVATGYTFDYGAGEHDILIATFDADGNTCMGTFVDPSVQDAFPSTTMPTPTVTAPTPTVLPDTLVQLGASANTTVICPLPQCEVTPETLDFGTVAVGDSLDLTFTITNTGDFGSTLTGDVTESCDQDSITSGEDSYSLGAGEYVTVTVRYKPTELGEYNCTVETGNPLCADVACTGTGGPPPNCVHFPTSIDFGTVTVGESRVDTFYVTNTGGGILSGEIEQIDCLYFSITDGEGEYNLAHQETLFVTVSYTPGETGHHVCTIANVCSDVYCEGTGGPPPVCQVEPTSLDFGVVYLGDSKDSTFTLRNTGGGTLTGSVKEFCDGYSIISGGEAVDSLTYSLASSESLSVTIRFEPASSGTHNCTVETGSACTDVSCTAIGDDPPQCEVMPTNIHFGTLYVGDHVDSTITIKNIGGGNLMGAVSESCAHYSIASGEGAYSLAADESVLVTVRFQPGSAGTHNCTVETGTDCADVLCSGIAMGSSGEDIFVKTLGGSAYDYAGSVVQTSDGGFVVGGATTSFGEGNGDNLLCKFDYFGNPIWTKAVGYGGNEGGIASVAEVSDGGLVVFGWSESFWADREHLIAKFDGFGNHLWSRTIRGANPWWSYGGPVIETSDGGLVALGCTNSFTGVFDLFLSKFDSTGAHLWTKILKGSNREMPGDLVETSNGQLVLAGYTMSFGAGDYDLLIAKLGPSGNLLWARTLGGTAAETGQSITEATEGGFVVTGYTASFGAGDNDLLIAKYDSTGVLLWTKTLGGTEADRGLSVVQASDGALVVTGYTLSFGAGDSDLLLTKFSASGDHLWSRTVGDSVADFGSSVIQTLDGRFIIAGYTEGFGVDDRDLLLACFDSTGYNCLGHDITPVVAAISPVTAIASYTVQSNSPTITEPSPTVSSHDPDTTVVCDSHPTGVENPPDEAVLTILLEQNYPNPFNPTTTIAFVLPERTRATLVVYDVSGKLVRKLIDDVLEGGYKACQWSGRDTHGNPVSSGVYFYRLTAGNRTLTKKMVLLK